MPHFEYKGYIDSVDNRTVTGWVYGPQGERPVLCIHINGCEAGFTTPTRFRSDLQAAGFGDGYYGFEFFAPDSVGEIGTVSVNVATNGFSLPFSTNALIRPGSNRCLPPDWRNGPERFRLPSFFLIGAKKCGTTALHHYLEQHPDVCMSRPKEPYYFEAEYDRGTTFYFNRYFSHWQRERIVGEARHRHLFFPYAAKTLFEFNPDAKLLAILRNPVERAVSSWWHWYSRQTDLLPFREAIAADLMRIRSGLRFDGAGEREIYARTLDDQGQGRYRTYVDSGYYYDQLQRYTDLFGRERLRIFLFDDLVSDACKVTMDALEFVGADPAPAQGFEYPVVNASIPGMRENVEEGTISWLIEHYRPHNERLEQMLGRSLAAWNRPWIRATHI